MLGLFTAWAARNLSRLWAAFPHPLALARRLMEEGGEQLHRALQLLGLPVLSAGYLLLCGGQVFGKQDNTNAIIGTAGILAYYCWGVYARAKRLREVVAQAGAQPPQPPGGDS